MSFKLIIVCCGSLELPKHLGIGYIDIYMLHEAIFDKQRLKQAWIELEQLYNKGKIKYLAVSNFNPNDMNI